MHTVYGQLGEVFGVRVIRKGDSYGLDNRWTYGDPETSYRERNGEPIPLVEIHYQGGMLSRYYLDTLQNTRGPGLWLAPRVELDASALTQVLRHARHVTRA